MTRGWFGASITRACALLEAHNMLRHFNQFPDRDPTIIALLRSLPPVGAWAKMLEKKVYVFHLYDGSVIDISIKEASSPPDDQLSFAFVGCPIDCWSYQEYLKQHGLALEAAGEMFLDDYDDYVMTQPPAGSRVYIRYDYAPSEYAEGRHPASHIHLGENNEIRVAARRIQSPYSFVLFCLRQLYPEVWSGIRAKVGDPQLDHDVRASLAEVSSIHFRVGDRSELYLQ